MNDRSAALDAAVRAQGKLIAEAQRLLTAYVETKRVHPGAVLTICSGSSTGRASATGSALLPLRQSHRGVR